MKTLLFALLAATAASAEVVVFQGARLIDGTGKAPLEKAALVVDGERIVAVGPAGKVKAPKGARTVDLSGRTIMPGIINAHGHVGLVVNGQNKADGYTRENVQAQLLQYEQYGVTSVLTLGLNRDLVYQFRDEQRQGKLGGLGLGYTLRAALDTLPLTARVIVAELVAEVVDWNRGPLAPLAGCPSRTGGSRPRGKRR